jgi:AcrR family transcriptional regulator
MALLAAAREVLITRGYREATIAEIVQLADVAVGTFYLHFRDKDDLFTAFVREEMGKMFEQIHIDLDGQTSEDVLARVVRSVLMHAYQRRELFLIACTEGTFAHAIMQSAQTRLTAVLLPALQKAQEQGLLQTKDSLLLAHLLTGMVVQSISWWFEHDTPGPEAMAESIFFLLDQGLPPSLLGTGNSQRFG